MRYLIQFLISTYIYMAVSVAAPPNPPAGGERQTIGADQPLGEVAISGNSKLRHFESAKRIAGKYLVVFKDESSLIKAANSGEFDRLAVARNVLPTTEAGVNKLAAALATANRARLRSVYFYAIRGFSIEATEADAIALANDPRVEYVAPVLETTLDTIQNSGGLRSGDITD